MPSSGSMEIPTDRELELTERVKTLHQALAFAASVIKSGEPWTETCESVIGGALNPSR